MGASSLEHEERYDIITYEEWYILVRVGTPRGSGKYIRFGLRIEKGAERTTIIMVDIFDIVQQVRDTGIHLKVDEEPKKSSTGPRKIYAEKRRRTHVYLS